MSVGVGARRPGLNTFNESPPLTLGGRPLWILAGQFGLVISVLVGFGALQPVKPNLFIALLFCCAASVFVFGPVGNYHHLIVSGAIAALLVWWACSYLWAENSFGWQRETELIPPMIVGLVWIASLLPLRSVIGGLLAAVYVTLVYTVVFTVLNPSTAMTHSDGVAGWTGGFVHKNALAPFMIFAIAVVSSFEVRRRRRLTAEIVAGAFILLSQSTTLLAVGLILLPLALLIRRAAEMEPTRRATLLLSSFIAAAMLGTAASFAAPQLLASRGKDLTLSGRTRIWSGVWDAIAEQPWTGYGPGGVWVNPAADPTRSILDPIGYTVFHAHNGYLEVLIQLGAVGLLIVLAIVALVFRSGLLLLRSDVALGTFLLIFVALIMLTSVSEVMLLGTWLAMLCVLHTVGLRARRASSAAAP